MDQAVADLLTTMSEEVPYVLDMLVRQEEVGFKIALTVLPITFFVGLAMSIVGTTLALGGWLERSDAAALIGVGMVVVVLLGVIWLLEYVEYRRFLISPEIYVLQDLFD